MLVEVYRKIKNGKAYSDYLDTDDLSNEDYAKFKELWDSGQTRKAKKFLCECV